MGAAGSSWASSRRPLDLLEEALAQEPDNAEALGHRATALAELGQQAQALACVRPGIGPEPDLAPAWTLRGSLLKELGRPDEAADCVSAGASRAARTRS